MRAGILTASLLTMACLAGGCASSKCESVCQSANACALDQRPADVECTPYCADVESFQKRAVQAGQADCEPLFQAHLDCWQKNASQICTRDFTGCTEAAQAWTDCVKAYCQTEAAAKDPNCSKGTSTLRPF